MTELDYQKLVSRADLRIDGAVPASDEGLPVGNGVMGTCIWTTPAALKFQINRVDVYACGCETKSFFIAHQDYAYACAFLDVEFVDYGEDAFPAGGVRQHLELYDGRVLSGLRPEQLAAAPRSEAEGGEGVSANVFVCPNDDVMVMEITDSREDPRPVAAVLRMLREPVAVTRNHRAVSDFVPGTVRAFPRNLTSVRREDTVVLRQRFSEGEYYCASAVAVRCVGRNVQVRQRNDREMGIFAEPGAGSFVVLVSSAATFDPGEDVAARAVEALARAEQKGAAALERESAAWWHDYWRKSYVRLHSEDGLADRVEAHHTYYQYIMATCSRGSLAPNFGGLLFSTRGDQRAWGAQQWGNNIACYYRGLSSANRPEIVEPYFRYYMNMYDSLARAAKQQWGAEGIFLPETTWFDGLEDLPDGIAEEMRDLYLMRKDWDGRSEAFKAFAQPRHPHNSRWNWKLSGEWKDGRYVFKSKGYGPFGHVTHMFRGASRPAWIAWEYYEHYQDVEWLRHTGYPLIKGIADFFCTFPNLRKDEDGRYHIHHVNNSEGYYGCRDSAGSMTALHSLPRLAIRASEILGVDSDRRAFWRHIADNLAPLATSDDPDALGHTPGKRRVWIGGLGPCLQQMDRNTTIGDRCYYFDLCTLETKDTDPGTFRLGEDTFLESYEQRHKDRDTVGALSRVVVKAALLGHAEKVKKVLPAQMLSPSPEYCFSEVTGHNGKVMANQLTLREGYNATGAQRLGNATAGLYLALVQSVPPHPGGPLTIRLFPAWPAEWDAEFRLRCRGGFVVGAAMKNGEIGPVSIESASDGPCRVRNPWLSRRVRLEVDGAESVVMDGEVLEFDTREGERCTLRPTPAAERGAEHPEVRGGEKP